MDRRGLAVAPVKVCVFHENEHHGGGEAIARDKPPEGIGPRRVLHDYPVETWPYGCAKDVQCRKDGKGLSTLMEEEDVDDHTACEHLRDLAEEADQTTRNGKGDEVVGVRGLGRPDGEGDGEDEAPERNGGDSNDLRTRHHDHRPNQKASDGTSDLVRIAPSQ